MGLNDRNGVGFAYGLPRHKGIWTWNQRFPFVFSVFSIYPKWETKKGRKNMVKDFRAAVQYFITVVSMKAKVRREAFKCRIQDITGNY